MAIKGEVHVKSMVWAPKITLNDGRYVIRPFECKIVGTAEGLEYAQVSTPFLLFFLRLPNGQYGPVSQLSRSEESCTGPFNWGEAHCAGER